MVMHRGNFHNSSNRYRDGVSFFLLTCNSVGIDQNKFIFSLEGRSYQ